MHMCMRHDSAASSTASCHTCQALCLLLASWHLGTEETAHAFAQAQTHSLRLCGQFVTVPGCRLQHPQHNTLRLSRHPVLRLARGHPHTASVHANCCGSQTEGKTRARAQCRHHPQRSPLCSPQGQHAVKGLLLQPGGVAVVRRPAADHRPPAILSRWPFSTQRARAYGCAVSCWRAAADSLGPSLAFCYGTLCSDCTLARMPHRDMPAGPPAQHSACTQHVLAYKQY